MVKYKLKSKIYLYKNVDNIIGKIDTGHNQEHLHPHIVTSSKISFVSLQ